MGLGTGKFQNRSQKTTMDNKTYFSILQFYKPVEYLCKTVSNKSLKEV